MPSQHLLKNPPTPLPCLRGRRKGRAKHGLDSTAAVDPVSQVPFRPRAVRTGCEGTDCGLPAVGLWGRLAFSDPLPTSFIFVTVQVAARFLPTYVLTYCGLRSGIPVCFKAPCGQVANVLFFALPELGLCWRLAFSDPLPTSFIFVSVQARLPHDFCPPMCSPSGCRCAFVPTCWASCLFL